MAVRDKFTYDVIPRIPTNRYSGTTIVATAGTAVAIGTGELESGITIKALPGNTGTITVGTESSQDYPLAAGEDVFVSWPSLDVIWIDSTVSGEGVAYLGS